MTFTNITVYSFDKSQVGLAKAVCKHLAKLAPIQQHDQLLLTVGETKLIVTLSTSKPDSFTIDRTIQIAQELETSYKALQAAMSL